MCEFMRCLQLMESLDAAFRGGIYEGAEWIGTWGEAVMESLSDHRCPHSQSLIWQIAHSSLQSLIMGCPCEGIAESILSNPETFVRTTLILASRCHHSTVEVLPVVYH